jgi:hypothetical protein
MFEEALALRRIVQAAEGGDMTIINKWQAYHDTEKEAWGEADGWLIRSRQPDDRRRHHHRGRGRGGRGRGRRFDDNRNGPGRDSAQGQ